MNDFNDEVREKLKTALRDLEEDPTGDERTEVIEVRERSVFRFRMREGGRGGKIDHRAIFDIRGGKVVVYAIFDRDRGYQKGDIRRRF